MHDGITIHPTADAWAIRYEGDDIGHAVSLCDKPKTHPGFSFKCYIVASNLEPCVGYAADLITAATLIYTASERLT